MGHPDASPSIKSLYSHLDASQLEEAEANLLRYLELVLRIYERITTEGQQPSISSAFDGSTVNLYDDQ